LITNENTQRAGTTKKKIGIIVGGAAAIIAVVIIILAVRGVQAKGITLNKKDRKENYERRSEENTQGYT
jgi:hypothetical protein